MLPRYRGRLHLVFALLGGIVLLAILFALTLTMLGPATPTTRGPLLLTVLVLTFLVSLLSGFLILRWLFRPYRLLVNEAERAPVAIEGESRNEAEFVLQTFQSVVARLQSQQRELELLSARASARADSAEKFSERVIASIPSGLLAFDAEGRATIINAPARALIDASDAAEGEEVRTLLRHVPELAEMIERCLTSGEVYRREEVSLKNSDGRARRLGATVAPIEPREGGRARGALCLITDITEVTELREQVALKKNLESLGEMSAGLSHEFKNALATLHGYAQLLQNLDLDERGRAAATGLLTEVRSLSAMVTSFLNFARPQPLQLEDVSLRELVTECSEELRALYQEKRAQLSTEGEFPNVRADERMLRQVLLNLLRNAAESFDEQETRRVTVRGSIERDAYGKNWAQVEIKDTGPGIPAENLQRIFIPFFTTKAKGHGVGLALAHRVITDHGGTLSAADSHEGGASFTFKLPVATDQ